MEIRVDGLHVVQRDGFAEQLFVEGQGEASVNVVAVEHRHAHDASHEVKVRQVLLCFSQILSVQFDKICTDSASVH